MKYPTKLNVAPVHSKTANPPNIWEANIDHFDLGLPSIKQLGPFVSNISAARAVDNPFFKSVSYLIETNNFSNSIVLDMT